MGVSSVSRQAVGWSVAGRSVGRWDVVGVVVGEEEESGDAGGDAGGDVGGGGREANLERKKGDERGEIEGKKKRGPFFFRRARRQLAETSYRS